MTEEREETLRRQILKKLGEGWWTLSQLSSELGISEREVRSHIPHVKKSAGRSFEMEPPHCRSCGFVFTDRRRLTRPSRCPRCRAERIASPSYHVREEGPD